MDGQSLESLGQILIPKLLCDAGLPCAEAVCSDLLSVFLYFESRLENGLGSQDS